MNKREFDYILQNGESCLVEFKERVNSSLVREMTGTARRKEIYELPLDAVREAVINAVVHRDYFLAGSHTVIEIFDDRIDISNPGGLPRGLSEKDFGRRAVRRNQIIASLLHRIEFVENMGTGINKIRTFLKVAGLPPPQFEFDDFYTIIFRRKQHRPKVERKVSGKTRVETRVETQVETRVETPLEPKLKTPDIILDILSAHPNMTLSELAKKIGRAVTTVERAASKLVREGRLRRIGPKKGGYWQVINSE